MCIRDSYDSMVRVSKLIEQLSSSGVIVFVVSHDFEFIVRTCTAVSYTHLDNPDRPRPIAEQMKNAAKLAEADRGSEAPAPQRKQPDRGDR